MAIHLGRSSPNASRDRPERRRERPARQHQSAACRSYLVLLPVGFALPPPLPEARCALTAPFHPCRSPPVRAVELGGVFLWHFPSGRPRRGLPGTVPPWSPDFPPSAQKFNPGRRAAIRPSGMGRFGMALPFCQTGRRAGALSKPRNFNMGSTFLARCDNRKGVMAQIEQKFSRRSMLRKAAGVIGAVGASALAACAP